MYFTARTLDDLMYLVLTKLVHSRNRVAATRGPTRELNGVLLKLADPRSRLSLSVTRGKVFSGLGELMWYFSKGNSLKHIKYYLSRYEKDSDDGVTVYGGYGPRLFKHRGKIDQVANVIAVLRNKDTSRRAVIQLFDGVDIAGKERRTEIPCTCTLQFTIRGKKLHMFTSMRSNDAFTGLPHDVFSFTMLQEIMARSLGVDVGNYKHAVGSLHLYEDDISKAKRYLSEGFHRTQPMPQMPATDPWPAIKKLSRLEASLRNGKPLPEAERTKVGYWEDLARLLEIYRLDRKGGGATEITQTKRRMTSNVFNTYISRREAKATPAKGSTQLEFPQIVPNSAPK